MNGNLNGELRARTLNKKVKEERYGIIGVEIKARRISLSQTLEALSDNVCSLSYLCKIEKNKIEPNRAFLREICKRLELSEEKVDYLFKLKEILISVVHAYIIGDINFIKKRYEEGKGLENYRFNIIKLIYCLAKKDIEGADIVNIKLTPLYSTMSDFDITIYALFSAILSFYKGEFSNALDDIEYLPEFMLLNDVEVLRDELVFKIHYVMNIPDTPSYYEIVKNKYYEYSYYNYLDYAKYLISCYYIKNNCEKSYEFIINTINDEKIKSSLVGVKSFFDNNVSHLIGIDDKLLNDFAKTLKYICIDNNKAISIIENNECSYFREDYDFIILRYLTCLSLKEKVDYIFKNGLPLAIGYEDEYLKKYFINEVARMPITANRNRYIVKAYYMAYSGIIDQFDFGDYRYDEEDDR